MFRARNSAVALITTGLVSTICTLGGATAADDRVRKESIDALLRDLPSLTAEQERQFVTALGDVSPQTADSTLQLLVKNLTYVPRHLVVVREERSPFAKHLVAASCVRAGARALPLMDEKLRATDDETEIRLTIAIMRDILGSTIPDVDDAARARMGHALLQAFLKERATQVPADEAKRLLAAVDRV